ncbi:hypothetical protein GCM10008966_22020 [Rhodovulum strictum]|uniref:hypothetical protein n=1 Tax=Rhodovulum strictum TaxID=58314 RepID=UPI001FE2815B|nr:hypothetical protein [Rhodovulum strictum]
MYTKITRSGGRQYLQLVEGYRNDEGKVRHRVVANLGRLEDLNPAKLDPLINGLNRAMGRSDNTAFPVEIESSKAYGNVFALHELWKDLGFDRALGRAMRSGRRKIEADAVAIVSRTDGAPMATACDGQVTIDQGADLAGQFGFHPIDIVHQRIHRPQEVVMFDLGRHLGHATRLVGGFRFPAVHRFARPYIAPSITGSMTRSER